MKHMKIAANEKGVSEIRGSLHNDRILEYHQCTSLKATSDEVPWCAAFVNWVLFKSGITGTKSAAARSFLRWGRSVKPKYGDVVVFWRQSPKSYKGHVGFFVSRGLFKVKVLGGNQMNRVSVRKYWRFMVLDYRRVKQGWEE